MKCSTRTITRIKHYASSLVMCEPWYQTQGPSICDVNRQMQNTEFHMCLHNPSTNPERENLILSHIMKDKMKHIPKYVTFEAIRQVPGYREKAKQILLEEIEKSKPFGSYRCFFTFVFAPLYTNYICRVIREVWAANTIAKLKTFWLEKYLAPGGNGFQVASNMWDEHVNTSNH